MSPQNKVNVLMVDDQPSKLLSYEVILEELGENLIKANSGRGARVPLEDGCRGRSYGCKHA